MAGQGDIRGACACRTYIGKAGVGHEHIRNHHDLYRSYDPLAEIDCHVQSKEVMRKPPRIAKCAVALWT